MIAFLLAGCQAVLSGALLFAACAKARQPDVLAVVLRAGRLPAVVIRLLILLLPALEAGLALAVLRVRLRFCRGRWGSSLECCCSLLCGACGYAFGGCRQRAVAPAPENAGGGASR